MSKLVQVFSFGTILLLILLLAFLGWKALWFNKFGGKSLILIKIYSRDSN